MDIMRILATFLVVFNHTGDFGFSYFRRFGSHTIAYWGYMLFPVMAKVSVPLFFMISGALLLGREDESRKKMLLRWIKIFAALLVFSCVSYAQQVYLGNEVFDIKHFVFVFFNNTWMNAYWYLYAYLGYLLTLPLLRKIAKSLTDSNYRYMIVLVLVLTGYLPMILYVVSKGTFSLNTSFKIDWLASSIFFFPLLGYYLERRVPVEKISAPMLLSLWAVNGASILFTCYVTHVNNALTGEFPQTFIQNLVAVNAICIYLTLKKLMSGKELAKPASVILSEVGACTFGMYLLHGMLLRAPKISLYSKISGIYAYIPITAISIRCIEVMVIAGIVTFILRRIPGVKKIL